MKSCLRTCDRQVLRPRFGAVAVMLGHRAAFTLVELLVVIGVIAVLIGILVPVLGGIRARARDVQCQSNIRQCIQLVLTYAAENRGQLPYGLYYAHAGGPPDGWGPVPPNDLIQVTLWSIVANMCSRHVPIEWNYEAPTEGLGWSDVVRCPEASQVQPHLVSYAGNLAAFTIPYMDAAYTGASREGEPWTRLVERPINLTQCLPSTALFWDTAVRPGAYYAIADWGGIGVDVDGGRFRAGAVAPQFRYLSRLDPFAMIPPGSYGYHKPVQMDPGVGGWRNIDPPIRSDGIANGPYMGNLRFRHSRDTTCNVGYADGHVGRFTGKFKNDGRPRSHDALRRYFMVKWPSGMGIAPDPNLPH